MKILKRILLLLAVTLILVVIINYPKLNILSGFSAKSTSSSVFLANRTLAFTDSTDNNFSPVNLATDKVNLEEKYATSSALGLLTRKAVYREGLGSVLVTKDYDSSKQPLTPQRNRLENNKAYPYGNVTQRDTIFSEINYQQLNTAVNSLFKDVYETRAVLVIYKDQIIAEQYGEGFTKDSRILGWSMTKSIMSTIYGIMQHQGKINVQDKAPISEWQNDDRKEISIHNLLQMNSGLEWDENYDKISDVTKMLFLEKDMTVMQREKPLTGKINASWNYSSGTSNLLSGILRQELGSHQEYLDYWYRELIDKIGMNSMVIETDMTGNYVASSYAWATPRDWGKFGLLYLHKGNWDGDQVFAPEWTDYVVEPTPTSNGRYGAQFWLNAKSRFPDVPTSMYFADGYQGQRIYILPEQDLVIVRFGLKKFNENSFLKGILTAIE
ncbi:serine hydrolase [Pseudotenacibaculum sp. MALMAid0570]|uniref:serine hydrolase domain-containing protein n=1 Tax=Pseudotenacibaculum sp. MALMAid0570 TaxID=3143938 RepID=UPI0032DEB909